jgi:hypothetical protein
LANNEIWTISRPNHATILPYIPCWVAFLYISLVNSMFESGKKIVVL